MRYRFADYEVDEEAFELRRGGASIPIEPKPLKLLIHLLSRYPAATSKQELLDAIWPGIAVTESAMSRAIRVVRAALGEEAAGSQGVIKTVRGVGFKIDVPVEILGAPVEPRVASGEPRQAALVAREDEMAQARRALAAALEERAQLLLLAGEPGIGKTRLAQEIGREAEQAGALLLLGSSFEGEGAPAYWPWQQIFRSYVDQCDPATLQRELGEEAGAIAEIVPEIASRVRRSSEPAKLDPVEARFRFFSSVTSFVRRAAGQRPLVVMLDDLHWADQPSQLLLEFLTRAVAPARVLMLGTYRDTEAPSPALQRTIEAAARQSEGGGCIALHALDRSGVEQLLHDTRSGEPAPELVDAIHVRSEGNPFFVQELARLVPVEEGAPDGPWSGELPPGLKQVLQRRLEVLPDSTVALLRLASVIGRDFSLSLLASAAGAEVIDVIEWLEPAENARILVSAADAGAPIRFSHALMRDALYDDLSKSQRIRHHLALAEALEKLYQGAVEPHLGEIASHYAAAIPSADPAAAIDHLVGAARYESRRLAFEEAVSLCERGLGILEAHRPADMQARSDLLELLAEARFHAGDRQGAGESYWRLCDAARAAGDGQQLARAAMGLTISQLFTADSHPKLVEVIEDALRLLPPGDCGPRAMLLACLSRQLTWSDRHAERESLSREALAMARRLGDPNDLIEVLGAHAYLLEVVGGDDERVAVIDELESLAHQQLIRLDVAAAHIHRAQLMAELARADDFDRELARHLEVSEEIRHPHHIAYAARFEAMRALWQGRLVDAERLVFEAFEKGQRSDPSYAFAAFSAQLGAQRRLQGRFGELEQPLLQAAERYPYMVSFRSGLALLYATEQRMDEAARAFESLATDDFAALIPNDPNYRLNLALLAEVCDELGAADAAGELERRLAEYRGRHIVVSTVISAGCGSRYLALMAAVRGDWDAAALLLEEAILVERRMRADTWLATTLFDQARVLFGRGAAGDGERAELAITEAERLVSEKALAGLMRGARRARAQQGG